MEEKPQDSPQVSVRDRAKIQAQLGNIKQQTVKLLVCVATLLFCRVLILTQLNFANNIYTLKHQKKGEKRTLEPSDVGDESFAHKGTVYFKNCEDCEYVLNAPSVKVLVGNRANLHNYTFLIY